MNHSWKLKMAPARRTGEAPSGPQGPAPTPRTKQRYMSIPPAGIFHPQLLISRAILKAAAAAILPTIEHRTLPLHHHQCDFSPLRADTGL